MNISATTVPRKIASGNIRNNAEYFFTESWTQKLGHVKCMKKNTKKKNTKKVIIDIYDKNTERYREKNFRVFFHSVFFLLWENFANFRDNY